MSTATVDTDALPVEHADDGDRLSSATIMDDHGLGTQPMFVFDGPMGGELVVKFDAAYYDDHRLVLTRRDGSDRRERAVFQAEHWGQWGDVSAWFYEHGIEGIPRRFR